MKHPIPTPGQVVRFVTVPRGSYASPGIDYRVSIEGKGARTRVHLERVHGGSRTSDPTWAWADAMWALMSEAD